jgi:hypothetical protein
MSDPDKEDAERYVRLVSAMFRGQEAMLRQLLASETHPGRLEIERVGLASFAAASAGMMMSLAGAYSDGDERLYVETLQAMMGTFGMAISKAPEAFDEAVKQGFGQPRH